MTTIVGIRFKQNGKIYYFNPLPGLVVNDHVIVETARGLEYGEMVLGPKEVADQDLANPLKDVLRKATAEDEKRYQENCRAEKEAFTICESKISQHKLPINLVEVSYTFDVSKIIFSFTSEGRVDFRELVKDLASVFKTRIELRQIGVRDQAKIVGGIGSCGRVLCCHSVLGDFHPVSIKMAKKQNLSLNPAKISGVCGRLMCCLKYENYDDLPDCCPKKKQVFEIPTEDDDFIIEDDN